MVGKGETTGEHFTHITDYLARHNMFDLFMSSILSFQISE